MIRPTIGRVVWYHPGPNDPTAIDATQPHAALIAHVENDRQVNLFVIDSEGGVYSRKSVRLAQDADKAESGGAQWMPFQTGQANSDFGKKIDVMESWVQTLANRLRELEAKMATVSVMPETPVVKGSKGATNADGTPWIPPMPDDEPARRNGKQKSA